MKSRIISAFLSAVTLLSMIVLSAGAEREPADFYNSYLIKLDVDQDGAVNSIDASYVLTEYASTATGHKGTFTKTQKYLADYDCNHVINAVDASEILGFYAKKATADKPVYMPTIRFWVSTDPITDEGLLFGYSYEECLEKLAYAKKKYENRKNIMYRIIMIEKRSILDEDFNILYQDDSNGIIDNTF